MNQVLLFLLLAVNCSFASAQSKDSVYLFSYFKDNGQDGLHLAYSFDGFNWESLYHDSSILKPAVGVDKLMRDPCIIRGGDGLFHMVWTVSWHEKGIGYATSNDLVHWSEQKFLPVMEQEAKARNCWAPEIFYNNDTRQYMIYWATTIPGRFKKGEASGDESYNHRMYYATTADFKSISPTKLLYDQGFNVIDATIVRSGNEFVMVLKDETKEPPQKNLRTAVSRSLTGPYSKPTTPITGNYWAEGPTVLNTGNKWIVYFDKYTEQKYGAVTSNDLQHWTDISEKIHFPEGVRHGTVFTVSRGEFDRLNK